MIINLRLTCALAALAINSSFPSVAWAEATPYHSQVRYAFAGFSGSDPTGCIWTYINLYVTERRVREEPGLPALSTWADLYIMEVDECQHASDEWDFIASTALPADAFRTSGTLQGASLQVTVDIYNLATGTLQPVTLDLLWTGKGDFFRWHDTDQYTHPGAQHIGRSRSAAISGSVLLSSENLTDTGTFYGTLAFFQDFFTAVGGP